MVYEPSVPDVPVPLALADQASTGTFANVFPELSFIFPEMATFISS